MTTRGAGQYSAAFAAWVGLVLLSHRFVQLRGTDTDFWPRWYGLRALLLEGRDPYGAVVTDEIVAQTSLAMAPTAARAAYGFVYPLPGALLIAPLAALPYQWAAAVWLGAGIPALALAAILSVRALGGGGATSGGWGRGLIAVPLALLSFPALWNVALVQPGLAVVPLMAIGIWASPRRPFWVGVALGGAALLKPQLAAPLMGAWAAYSLVRWRGRESRSILGGMTTAAVLLGGCAFVLMPSWPAAWLDALRAYAAVPAMEPLSSAVYRLAQFGPLGDSANHTFGAAATAVVGASLAVWAIRGWLADSRTGAPTPARGVTRTIVAGALLVPPAWETNALVLLIPLAGVLGQLRGRGAVWFAVASVALSVVLAPLALVLPWRSGAVTIAAYVALWAGATWWAGRERRPRPAARSAAAAGAA